ncbi:MAG: Na/Pi cotransporter family protein [Cellulosilyticum sp.]|nr:Na/Pi cotransporter family protein [Cellulosilyticum sp.]
MDWTELILNFIGGFGLFMFGMEYMGDGLQKAAGSKMKNILAALTRNRLLGVLVGAGVTALIQSSSATTVMVVGFVNVGLLNLKQAVGVIMGANIGTTITSWIVALGEWTEFLKPSVLAPIFIVAGVLLIMFVKNTQINSIGQILFGFGSLFLGLDMMSTSAKPLSQLEEVKNLFLVLGNNPLLGIVTGAVVTAVIQSSSASVGILQALALAGLVPWGSAIYIILGQNIGTCITAILSSISGSLNAKRAAAIHFLFNLIGSVIFGFIAIVVFNIWLPDVRDQLITVTQISVVHTVFNVLNTILLFPFGNTLVHLAETLVKGREKNKGEQDDFLDERLLQTPHIALQTAKDETVRMGEIASNNVQMAVEALFNRNEEKVKAVFETEKEINTLQEKLNAYLIKLANLSLSEADQIRVTELFHMVSDIERVGDHADNIAELAMGLKNDNLSFSEMAEKELESMTNIALESFTKAIDAYEGQDKALAQEVLPLEEQVDRLEEKLRSRHMKRLAREQCSPIAGILYLDMVSNLERIADHAANIAQLILDDTRILTIDDDNQP